MMEEAALDFEHELYKFAGQREIVSRYVGFLAHFETLPQHATHCALKLLSKLIRQCKLEGMLFQLSVLHCLLKILENPASKFPEHKELHATCTYIVRRFFEVPTNEHCAQAITTAHTT